MGSIRTSFAGRAPSIIEQCFGAIDVSHYRLDVLLLPQSTFHNRLAASDKKPKVITVTAIPR
jgi:hypothetical protein